MALPETTENGIFEGLFVRALDVAGPLEQELKECGFDRQRPKAKYPSQVFFECLEVARRHRFPELSPEEGQRALGRAFFTGFRKTILGSVMTAALPIFGARTAVTKVPGRLQRLRSDLQVTLEKRGPDQFVLTASDPVKVGDFFAGALQEALKVAGAASPRLTSSSQPGGWILEINLAP